MNTERVFALACLLISSAAIVVSSDYAVEEVGPDLMPRIWSILIWLSSAFALWGSCRSSSQSKTSVQWDSWMGLGLLFLYLWVIPLLGYFGSTFLFLLLFFVYLERTRLGLAKSAIRGVVIGLAWNIFSFFVFVKFLGVQLPLHEVVEGWVY